MNSVNMQNSNVASIDLLLLPKQVVFQITKNVIQLPEDLITKIASYMSKPKDIAKCSLLCKDIKVLIAGSKDYWDTHIKKRWGNDSNEENFLNFNVSWTMEVYAQHYRVEKASLKGFKLLCENEFQLAEGGTDLKIKHYAAIYELAYPYTLGENPKASWLFIAGLTFLEAHHANTHEWPEKAVSWLERSAEKGHPLAACEIGMFYLYSELHLQRKSLTIQRNTPLDPKRFEKGIKYLRIAASKKHSTSIDILDRLKKREFDDVNYRAIPLNNLSEKSKNTLIQVLCKRPHEDGEPLEDENPVKRLKQT